MTGRNAVIVAPLDPGHPSSHLGATKKIELVLGLIHRLGFNVHLVDSSHSISGFAASINGRAGTAGGTPITLWRPFCLPSRKLGKLLNIFASGSLFSRLSALRPAFVWVYNSYAFEANAAIHVQRAAKSAVVLELEDLPMARERSLSPKPWLDQRFFPRLLRIANLVTYVNAATQRRFSNESQRSLLFPSLLQQALVDGRPGARFTGTNFRAGYFGGLEVEKGADVLLNAIETLPLGWKLVVTGVGSLHESFEAAQKQHPGKIEYHGRVSHEKVLSLMHSCDAIVNPHTPISMMREGVFPFKVCEALASGALLLSTDLPAIDIDLSSSVLTFGGSPEMLTAALAEACEFYASHMGYIQKTREEICARFSEQSVFEKLRLELDFILSTP